MRLSDLIAGAALAANRERIEAMRERAVSALVDESLSRVPVRVRIVETCQARIAPGPEGVRHCEAGAEIVLDGLTASALFSEGRAVPLDDMGEIARCVGVEDFRKVMGFFKREAIR